MCEQPETDMVSGFFHGLAATGRVQAAFHFATLPFAGRLMKPFRININTLQDKWNKTE